MKKLQRILVVITAGLLIINTVFASENKMEDQRSSSDNASPGATDADSNKLKMDLIDIIKDHVNWLETEGKEGRRANLGDAFLKDVNLSEVNLARAYMVGVNLEGADLSKANLSGANLVGAKLSEANLEGAYIFNAKLEGADLSYALLSQANFLESDLNSANLYEANLYGTNLSGTNLSKAILDEAFVNNKTRIKDADLKESTLFNVELSNIVFEPKQGSQPYIPSIASYLNLSSMTYNDSSHGLVDLRDGFRKAGLRKQERKITYAIKHRERVKLLKENNIFPKFEGMFNLIMFEIPCKYGMVPGRTIWILGAFILLFAIPYMIALKQRGEDGIWQEWLPDRIRTDLGAKKPILLNLTGFSILKTGIYFSLISAFSIGWREIHVGNWIARIQRREYTLRPSGWVRTLSGIQSLISVYLLALWILTYFGRPFD